MCRNCNCSEQKSSCFDTCCEKTKACDNKHSTSCIFYKLENQSNSRLFTIKVENGTPLNTILEEFDKKLNLISTPDFSAFKIPFLKGKYNVINIKQFSEAVSGELFKLDDRGKSQQTNINALEIATTTNTNDISKIKYPQITDSAAAGFTINSDIKVVLQKLTDKLSTLSAIDVTSPSINSIETPTIKFSLEGTLNHTLKANVKISNQSGNILQSNSDGLYVSSTTIPNFNQTLSLNGNQLSISGGNSLTLPSATLTRNGTVLGIVGSSVTVDLASVLNSNQQPLSANNSNSISFTLSGTLNHTLTASVIKSGDAGNALELRTNGVYVSKTTAQEVLNEINTSPNNSSLRTTLCSIIDSSCGTCFSYYVRNTTSGALVFNYYDCNNTLVPITIAANSGQYLSNVRQIPASSIISNNFDVTNLGRV